MVEFFFCIAPNLSLLANSSDEEAANFLSLGLSFCDGRIILFNVVLVGPCSVRALSAAGSP